ncbi:MAG: RidA family protein [bacterium]|nr:RidA family protein [bacterium]
MRPEEKLRVMGLELPAVAPPLAAYVPAVHSGCHVFVSGQLPVVAGRLIAEGKLGAEISVEQGRQAARTCALNCLAALKAQVGDLDRVVRMVKVTGFVASAAGFTGQPQVVNGASELLLEVFGDRGRHARAAVGVAELPLGAPVEVDLVAEVAAG